MLGTLNIRDSIKKLKLEKKIKLSSFTRIILGKFKKKTIRKNKNFTLKVLMHLQLFAYWITKIMRVL